MAEAEQLEAIERERARARMLAGQATDPEETLPQGRLGVSRDTVHKDATGVRFLTPDNSGASHVTGADGKQYPATMA